MHQSDFNNADQNSTPMDFDNGKQGKSKTAKVIKIEITVAQGKVEPVDFQKTKTKRQPGGFILRGKDRLRRDLMETSSGAKALHIFSKIGRLKPVYLSNEFFKSIEH